MPGVYLYFLIGIYPSWRQTTTVIELRQNYLLAVDVY